jgi:hypothetical protein
VNQNPFTSNSKSIIDPGEEPTARKLLCNTVMTRRLVVRHIIIIVAYSVIFPFLVSARDAVLPQGAPEIQKPNTEDQSRREEIRTKRQKQQGQSENYRVKGNLQGGSAGPKANEIKGHNRQDTGIEDPSVNPGQAKGLKTIRGRVLRSDEHTLTIEQGNGQEAAMTLDPQTRTNHNFHPGDRITGTVTNQGRAVVIQKQGRPKP